MSVLITGITGFIGSNLAQRLVSEGYDVYGLVRHVSRSALRPLESILDKVRFVEGELGEYHSVRSSIEFSAPDVVVHLGALTPVRYSFENPFPYFKVNFEGSMNVAHAIIDGSPKSRLILASSAEVYGWQDHRPILEETKLNPSSPYAVSKAAADSYVQMATRIYGLRATVLRSNNTYGRLHEHGFFVEYVISSMLANRTVYVGAPEHIRDYMLVDDHVDAYVKALNRTDSVNGTFNVSPGNPVSNIELARKIGEIVGFKGKIAAGSYPPGYPVRPAKLDTDYIVLDSSKIRSHLGWTPSVGLDEGIARVVESWGSSDLH
ncbi:MAG: GDP-mannose 4,6-dehydratase [Candidatus Bathyarchaeia archaeon]